MGLRSGIYSAGIVARSQGRIGPGSSLLRPFGQRFPFYSGFRNPFRFLDTTCCPRWGSHGFSLTWSSAVE